MNPVGDYAPLLDTNSLYKIRQLSNDVSERNAWLAELLERVAQQEHSAFALLYQHTCLHTRRAIRRIVKQTDLADNALQETYEAIWKKASTFDAKRGSALGWINAIARNSATNEIRSITRIGDVHWPSLLEVAAEWGDVAYSEQSHLTRATLHCLLLLEERERDIILLTHYCGVKHDVLTERYDIPTATVKTRLRRSLMRLRVLLRRHYQYETKYSPEGKQ